MSLLFPTPTHPPVRCSASLADQLGPISKTLLKTPPNQLNTHTAKPRWINPAKPQTQILSNNRQKRQTHKNSQTKNNKIINLTAKAASDEEFYEALADAFTAEEQIQRDEALILLSALLPWPERSTHFIRFLRSRKDFIIDTVFFNVAMKALRRARQWHSVERLALDMIDTGVALDNITYSTIITTASRCRRFDKAVEWFERMYRTGVIPDEVTYSAVLDVYAQMGKKEEVLSLYERARGAGWKPDEVAFGVLGRMFGESGDFEGIQYVMKEMREIGVKPNVVVYNTLLEALGKARRPGIARDLFEEMLNSELLPNEKTLSALIKVYGKARWSRDALQLWERIRKNGWPMDFIVYNTLLSMCADLGLEEEAEKLFEDMKRTERYVKPDSWSYTAMVNIYGRAGKVDQAMEMFDEMLANGVALNVMSCTCLIQCLGKAGRIGDAVRVFEVSLEKGIVPDGRLCGCLLSVVALSNRTDMDVVLACLTRANKRLAVLVTMLADEQIGIDAIKEEFQAVMNDATIEVRRPFCNCLIDICRNQNFPSKRATELFYLGMCYQLYPGLHTKRSDEWTLNLRSLSIGAAKTAFEWWMHNLSSSIEQKEILPHSFSIYIGSGSHKFSQSLSGSFTSHLTQLAAPFKQNKERNGCLIASKEELCSWLHSQLSPAAATA